MLERKLILSSEYRYVGGTIGLTPLNYWLLVDITIITSSSSISNTNCI